MGSLTDEERAARECLRRIRALCAKHGATEAEIRATVWQLRTQFDVTEEEALDAAENICMQPKRSEARA